MVANYFKVERLAVVGERGIGAQTAPSQRLTLSCSKHAQRIVGCFRREGNAEPIRLPGVEIAVEEEIVVFPAIPIQLASLFTTIADDGGVRPLNSGRIDAVPAAFRRRHIVPGPTSFFIEFHEGAANRVVCNNLSSRGLRFDVRCDERGAHILPCCHKSGPGSARITPCFSECHSRHHAGDKDEQQSQRNTVFPNHERPLYNVRKRHALCSLYHGGVEVEVAKSVWQADLRHA